MGTKFELGDIVQTIKGDRMSGIKKSGKIVGFGRWRDSRTLKIDTEDKYAKRRVSILEKNAIFNMLTLHENNERTNQ